MHADPKMQNKAYTMLLQAETTYENHLKVKVYKNSEFTATQEIIEISKIEDTQLMSRLINADYFRRLKHFVLTKDFV